MILDMELRRVHKKTFSPESAIPSAKRVTSLEHLIIFRCMSKLRWKNQTDSAFFFLGMDTVDERVGELLI